MAFRQKPVEVDVQVLDREPQRYTFGSNTSTTAHEPPAVPHAPYPSYAASLFDVGIFKDTLAPSLALHSSLAIAAWGAGRYTNRLEAKDWLWPAAPVINTWWSAVGRRIVIDGLSPATTLKVLSWPERLLLTGVTAWGVRLFARIASRSVKRGKDDPRYESVKKEEGFWNSALVKVFLPEAVFQAVISLPFTAPFRHTGAVMTGYHPYIQMFAVGLFGTGFALEVLADYQLKKHKETESGLMTNGVWSIVRHPNYLGDCLMHLAFPILLYGSDMLAPLELLGPIANYIFLRYVGGDAETETSQEERYEASDPAKAAELAEYREKKNSFWPSVEEFKNTWTWGIVGCGLAVVALEETLKMFHTEGGWL